MPKKKVSGAKPARPADSRETRKSDPEDGSRSVLMWICGSILLLVPVAFSRGVYRIFVLPKFAVLLIGAALILVGLAAALRNGPAVFRTLKSPLTIFVCLYVAFMGFSIVSS